MAANDPCLGSYRETGTEKNRAEVNQNKSAADVITHDGRQRKGCAVVEMVVALKNIADSKH